MPNFRNANWAKSANSRAFGTNTTQTNLTNNNDVAGIDFSHAMNGGVGVYVDDQTNWTGTITFEITRDPAATNSSTTTWTSILMTNDATGAVGTTTTAKGNFYANLVGVLKFRARLTSVGGNTARVLIVADPG